MTMQDPNQPTMFSPDDCSGRQLRDAFGKFATGITKVKRDIVFAASLYL